MALGLIDVPSWLALVEIFIMQATTVAVLAYAPKSAIKIRIICLRRMTEISLEELAIRTGSVIGFAAAAMAMIVQLHAFASAVIVGLGIHDPEEWPLMYGRISDAWSVRRFWGLVWHQQLRRPLVSYSELLTYKVLRIPKRNGILARYVRALGIALEDILFTTHRFNDERLRRGPKVFRSKALGYLWTMAFFVWTAPVWTYPAMRHSSPQKIKPVPFSVFKYLFG
ncbi:hypothetical protein CISG_05302 [Coccidioides immitis RMSCC 3703]|uniref:Wax synthase domain-containing protein n=1 Tax=Coccidioides immitis RMSCC 3703 TaxID=454286 RepID=A0A0J8QXE6_COCIT|nr:hypothetical protein CISG_05302 [Coccidioides immitis RMSCC 3703]